MPTSVSTNDMSGQSNVPAFLSKLWRLVEDAKYDSLISWSTSGQSFIIHDQTQFAKDVLPLFFKHNNMASFIRQLNMYGFRKVVSVDGGGLRGGKEDVEFYHNYFSRGQESLLEYIKRKAPTHQRGLPNPTNAASPDPATHSDSELRNELVRELLTDVNQLQGKQKTVDSQLAEMKVENESLWREVITLRNKHIKQQQIVEKLIHFLATLVHQARGDKNLNKNIGLKRKHALMIDSGGKVRKNFKTSVPTRQVGGIKTLQKSSRAELENGPIISDITYEPHDTSPRNTDNDRLPVNMGMEKDVIINSPESVSGLCAADDLVLCENLFDEDVLPPSITEDEMISDSNRKYPDFGDPSAQADMDLMSSALNTPKVDLWEDSEPGTSADSRSLELALQNKFQNDHGENILRNDDRSSALLSTAMTSPRYQSNGPKLSEDRNPLRNIFNHHESSQALEVPTDNLNHHIEGVDTELDWLQDQLLAGGLNIDSNTLLGIFNTEEATIPGLNDCLRDDKKEDGGKAKKMMLVDNRVF